MFAQRLEFTFLKSCRAIVHQQNNSVPRGPANCSSELALDCRRLDSHQSHPLESSPSPVLSKFSAPLSLDVAHRSIRSLARSSALF